jgi:hypothetical protein
MMRTIRWLSLKSIILCSVLPAKSALTEYAGNQNIVKQLFVPIMLISATLSGSKNHWSYDKNAKTARETSLKPTRGSHEASYGVDPASPAHSLYQAVGVS